MTSTVDEAALADALATILERVRRGERVEIAREGRVFAVLTPAAGPVGITGRELAARLGDLVPPGDGFGDDLEAARADLLPVTASDVPKQSGWDNELFGRPAGNEDGRRWE